MSVVFFVSMNSKPDVWQGTLALMVLKTLERTGSLRGYGIAQRIKQTAARDFCLALLLVSTLALPPASQAQSSQETDLYTKIADLDRHLFEQGFNGHDIAPFQDLISEHFEFYHDTAGITPSKAAFLSDLKNGLFALSYRARRELLPGR